MASASNVNDASVPTPKKTCDNNVVANLIKESYEKEKMIRALKEIPASFAALKQLMSCEACKSFARAPIRYCALLRAVTKN